MEEKTYLTQVLDVLERQSDNLSKLAIELDKVVDIVIILEKRITELESKR